GAGVVVATTHRDDSFGEYLSIRISQSNMTLMVPASAAAEKGVRPIVDPKTAKQLLDSLASEGEPLPDNPQHRARQGQERTKTGQADVLASVLRDYTSLERTGKKLSATELRTLTTAKVMFASEIALVEDIEIAQAADRVELALGNELDS
ncbi:MAG: transcriptional regulator, CarD family, partial [Thermoleophilia bacterium]|nr:transcriptional regulator, CarD family [Thermoleophilia bacterium]